MEGREVVAIVELVLYVFALAGLFKWAPRVGSAHCEFTFWYLGYLLMRLASAAMAIAVAQNSDAAESVYRAQMAINNVAYVVILLLLLSAVQHGFRKATLFSPSVGSAPGLPPSCARSAFGSAAAAVGLLLSAAIFLFADGPDKFNSASAAGRQRGVTMMTVGMVFTCIAVAVLAGHALWRLVCRPAGQSWLDVAPATSLLALPMLAVRQAYLIMGVVALSADVYPYDLRTNSVTGDWGMYLGMQVLPELLVLALVATLCVIQVPFQPVVYGQSRVPRPKFTEKFSNDFAP
ncbi:uncharacterized protein V1510DRAFT_419563 [Dipodascopsis tothii]|uniref:uncharacterized protein n=1 Tax=Dipodascopsis tothii TaxID=44089 RepID=UPI0034CF024C